MEQARQRIVAGIALPAPAAVAAADWQDAASDQGGVARIGAILDAYTRGNLTNLVALTALRLRLEQPQAPPGRLLPAIAPPDAPPALDPLPQLADLSPELAAQVRALAARHGGTGEVIPSLYLHLAHWPRLLEVLPRWLSALYAPAVLEVVRDAAPRRGRGRHAAARADPASAWRRSHVERCAQAFYAPGHPGPASGVPRTQQAATAELIGETVITIRYF